MGNGLRRDFCLCVGMYYVFSWCVVNRCVFNAIQAIKLERNSFSNDISTWTIRMQKFSFIILQERNIWNQKNRNLRLLHSIHWLWSTHHMTGWPDLCHWMSMTEWRIRWHTKLGTSKIVWWRKMGWSISRTRATGSTEWWCIRWWTEWSACVWTIVLLRCSWIWRWWKTCAAYILWWCWTRRWWARWCRRRCVLWCIRSCRWSALKLHWLTTTSWTSLSSIRKYGSTKWIWSTLCKTSRAIALIIWYICTRSSFPCCTCII